MNAQEISFSQRYRIRKKYISVGRGIAVFRNSPKKVSEVQYSVFSGRDINRSSVVEVNATFFFDFVHYVAKSLIQQIESQLPMVYWIESWVFHQKQRFAKLVERALLPVPVTLEQFIW